MRIAKHSIRILAVLVSLSYVGNSRAQSSTAKPRLTIEQLIEIKHPSDPVWSPDGKHVAFIWDRADIRNLYVASADGKGQPVQLTSFPDASVHDFFWNDDSDTLYFPHEGALWRVPSAGGTPKPAWNKPDKGRGFVPSPDGKRVAFVRGSYSEDEGVSHSNGSDLIVRWFSDGTESTVAHDAVSIGRVLWSPDGKSLCYTAGSRIIHHDESPSYSGEKLIYRVSEFAPGQIYAAKLDGSKPIAVAKPGEYGGLAWIDANRLVFDGQSSDFKTYFIYTADAATGSTKVIHEIHEEKFWSIPDWGEAGAQPWPSPDGKWIAFLSDQDGWDHLYVMPSAGGDAVQITKGKFEAWRPAWSHDSMRIAFDANLEDHPGDRVLGIAKIGADPAHAEVIYINSSPGTNIEPHWSEGDARLVYQHTDTHNSADLFVTNAAAGAQQPVRLTDSMPASIDRSQLVEPQFVHYPGPDGQQDPGWLFVPKNINKNVKHPAILWIHGDGVNQNYDGWHVQRNYAVYYSIHQYFLQKGYVVFAPDYRGSIGYGRDWRTGVHMDVGGKDAKDAWMGANYLKSLPYVDPDRIGVWGLSYGGFFTLIAMTDQPKLFRCGVDVAGVVDYVMYYGDPYHGDWTASRIGTPEQNPEVYKNASPISHIDRLERPLLVLHGTSDVNVPFLESVWLMDEALKKHKGDLVNFMIYPGEFHYFSREHVLRDAWHRVDDFFDLHLRASAAAKPKPN